MFLKALQCFSFTIYQEMTLKSKISKYVFEFYLFLVEKRFYTNLLVKKVAT